MTGLREFTIVTIVGVAGVLSSCTVVKEQDDVFSMETGSSGTAGSDGSTSSAETVDEGTGATPTTNQPTTDPSATGTETGEDGCGAGMACIEPTPDGWYGPVAVHLAAPGEPAPDCGETAYPDKGLTLLDGYHDPGPAICDCTCQVNMGTSCYSYVYSMTSCPSGYQTFQQLTQDCHAFSLTGGGYFYSYVQNQPFCQAMKTEEFPEVDWDYTVTTCRGAEVGGACGEGGVCTPRAPDGFSGELCIFAQGEHECPAGEFTEKFTRYSGVEDDRDCTNCTCGTAVANCDNAVLEVYDNNDCSGGLVGTVTNGACNAAVAGGQSVHIDFGAETNCPVNTMPEPEGTVAPTGPFTYCCQAG